VKRRVAGIVLGALLALVRARAEEARESAGAAHGVDLEDDTAVEEIDVVGSIDDAVSSRGWSLKDALRALYNYTDEDARDRPFRARVGS
jgi:hypothetical protein